MDTIYANMLLFSAPDKKELDQILDSVRLGDRPFSLQKIIPAPLKLFVPMDEDAIFFAKLRDAGYLYARLARGLDTSPALSQVLAKEGVPSLSPNAYGPTYSVAERKCYTEFLPGNRNDLTMQLGAVFSFDLLEAALLKKTRKIEAMTDEEREDFIRLGDRLLSNWRHFKAYTASDWRQREAYVNDECLYVKPITSKEKFERAAGFRILTEGGDLQIVTGILSHLFPKTLFLLVSGTRDDPDLLFHKKIENGVWSALKPAGETEKDKKEMIAELWREFPDSVQPTPIKATELKDLVYLQQLPESELKRNADILEWDIVSYVQNLTSDFLLEQRDKINWEVAVRSQDLDGKVLDGVADMLDWEEVCLCQEIPNWLFDKYANRVTKGTPALVMKQKPSLSWMRENFEFLGDLILEYQCLPEDFLEEVSDGSGWSTISYYQLLSPKFISKHKNELDRDKISRGQPLSADDLLFLKDYVNWSEVSRNRSFSLQDVFRLRQFLDLELFQACQRPPFLLNFRFFEQQH